MSTDLKARLRALPKIDLHRHLEGSIRPATIAQICREHNVELPTYDPDELSPLVQIRAPVADLGAFLKAFATIQMCFTDREAMARIAYEAVEDAHLDNVRYLELRLSPEFMAMQHRLPLADVMDGVVDGVALAVQRFPVTAKLIVTITRQFNEETMGMPWPSPTEVARLAVDYADRGVVGLDLAGKESGYPPELFVDAFEIARQAGLGITAHAGEDDGPESIRGAIECLGAARIGHGVHIIQDSDVMRLARDRGVTFEVCPTSSVLTRAVESLESHPLRRLHDAGLSVTINTDDPGVCAVTLTDEYALAVERLGFTVEELEALVENARGAAFHV